MTFQNVILKWLTLGKWETVVPTLGRAGQSLETLAVRPKQPRGSTIFSSTWHRTPAVLAYSYTTPCSRYTLSTVRLTMGLSSRRLSWGPRDSSGKARRKRGGY